MQPLLILSVLLKLWSTPAKEKVFICTDPKSQVYHMDELCKELEKCKYEIKKMDEWMAKEESKRSCKVCSKATKKQEN